MKKLFKLLNVLQENPDQGLDGNYMDYKIETMLFPIKKNKLKDGIPILLK